MRKLDDVCHFTRGPFGGALKKEFFVNDGYAVYEQQHAIYNQFDNIRYFIDEEKFLEMKRFELLPGDLIMSCSGTMGRIAIVPNGIKKGVINQALLKLTPKTGVNIKFLKHWFDSDLFQYHLSDHVHGAAIKNVASVAILKEIPIPFPPLSEQKRIAAILDKADAIRRKRQQAIQLADDFLRAVFLDMFGDPLSNPKGWDLVCLNEISPIKGEYGSGKAAIPYTDGSIRYIRITDINERSRLKDEKVSLDDAETEYRKYMLEEGDLLFARSGATVGKTYLYSNSDGPAVFAGYLIRFRIDRKKAMPEFIKSIVDSKYYWEWVKSFQRVVAQPNINAQQYGNEFRFILPPLVEQKKFVDVRRKVLRLMDKIEKAKQGSLFESLSQKAFSGKL